MCWVIGIPVRFISACP